MKNYIKSPRRGSSRIAKKHLLAVLLCGLILAGGVTYAVKWRYYQANPGSDKAGSQKTEDAKKGVTLEDNGPTQLPSSSEIPQNIPAGTNPPSTNYRLVTENEQFKIRQGDDNYVITLYAIINSPQQAEFYRDQLREYKQNALAYLESDGINTTKVSIRYEPAEAQNL